jgi:hypothetical protein
MPNPISYSTAGWALRFLAGFLLVPIALAGCLYFVGVAAFLSGSPHTFTLGQWVIAAAAAALTIWIFFRYRSHPLALGAAISLTLCLVAWGVWWVADGGPSLW